MRLAGAVIYANSSLRADPSILARNRRAQSGLWAYSISGDLPIVLLRVADSSRLELVRQMIQAHAYWRMKGLAVDLVIWNEDQTGYRQPLHDEIIGMITSGIGADSINRPGGILVRFAEQISIEDRILMQTVARAIISDNAGPLADQLDRKVETPRGEDAVPILQPSRYWNMESSSARIPPRHDLQFFNGIGGFSPDGKEYVMTISQDQMTPAPWCNVLANPVFGSVVSESGSANTWSENAHEFRLTPWKNDPVSDSCGEAFYLRDEETGIFWSPTLLPRPGSSPYLTRHGFGYSVFEHSENGIHTELCIFVAVDEPIKISAIRIRNDSGRKRTLSLTGYVEWVLADLHTRSKLHLTTSVDSSGAVFVQNPYSADFSDRVAFFDVNDPQRTVTGDRMEFLGRNGSLTNPAAMTRRGLSGTTGSGLDPCAALQVSFTLAPDREREVIFTLGASGQAADARNLLLRYRSSEEARHAQEQVMQHWSRVVGAIHVTTPDTEVNVLANGWLLYQTFASRFWARSGYYQPGGAFGFRDQLQDAMAIVYSEPGLVREHLLRCAGHQFPEGDVQHWWHPPSNRGVRTHCSDDFLWLPAVVCRYIKVTGDAAILDESANFLGGRLVRPGEDSYYDLPEYSDKSASLYDHCTLAILHGLQFGEHGLPLMGSGDWNDGMNLVGIQGKGESIWLACFLYDVLRNFAGLACNRGDTEFAQRCRQEAAKLQENLEKHGWDGEWYRRAYFDDGTPLGSASSEECQIDSIAQSWSVLSEIANSERARRAMSSLDQRLVRRKEGIIQLLDPPFDKSQVDPGYIKGYVPGVRENGGQYTHAAIWAAMAFAKLGDSAKAWELFSLMNPINHCKSPESLATYKVEPYVVAADVYSVSPLTGRGGWTWYTGSAGWMYRLIMESLLGVRIEADRLYFSPCMPAEWKFYEITYRFHETNYRVRISASELKQSALSVSVDDVHLSEGFVQLVDDRRDHRVEIVTGKTS